MKRILGMKGKGRNKKKKKKNKKEEKGRSRWDQWSEKEKRCFI